MVPFGVLQKRINACFASSLLQGNRHLCRWHVCTKSGLSTLKLLEPMWNGHFSFHFELLFTITCFKWLTENLLKNDSPSKVGCQIQQHQKQCVGAMHERKWWNEKTFFTFSRMRRQKSPLFFRARSRIFSHTPFFARHYSLPPRQPSVFARLARWQ